MYGLQLLLALALTFFPMWVWLDRLVPVGTQSRYLLVSGYALLLGMIGITLVMRLLSFLGIPFSLTSIASVAGFIFLSGIIAPRKWRTSDVVTLSDRCISEQLTWAQRILICICLALILSRLIALGIEVGTRPQFSWDGKQHWTKQAKVFFELGRVATYVPLDQWLALGTQDVYTNMHPDYPITTPLLQAWTNVALGEWHDSLMNLPWLMTWISIGLIFYAQARNAGIDSVISAAGSYVVLSLPYLNTHVALAGYADLLLALCFLASVCAFYNWSQRRQYWQATLLLLCSFSGLLIKNEGFFWVLAFLPGVILVICGIRFGVWVVAAATVALFTAVVLMPDSWVIAGHSLEELSLRYRPAGLSALYHSFLLHDNWHFLTYLFIAALFLLLWHFRRLSPSLAPVASVLVSAFALYFFLYLFTRYSFGAVRFSSLNRVALQLMPAAAFFTILVYAKLLANVQQKSQRTE
jgi:hypothetical protein